MNWNDPRGPQRVPANRLCLVQLHVGEYYVCVRHGQHDYRSQHGIKLQIHDNHVRRYLVLELF